MLYLQVPLCQSLSFPVPFHLPSPFSSTSFFPCSRLQLACNKNFNCRELFLIRTGTMHQFQLTIRLPAGDFYEVKLIRAKPKLTILSENLERVLYLFQQNHTTNLVFIKKKVAIFFFHLLFYAFIVVDTCSMHFSLFNLFSLNFSLIYLQITQHRIYYNFSLLYKCVLK